MHEHRLLCGELQYLAQSHTEINGDLKDCWGDKSIASCDSVVFVFRAGGESESCFSDADFDMSNRKLCNQARAFAVTPCGSEEPNEAARAPRDESQSQSKSKSKSKRGKERKGGDSHRKWVRFEDCRLSRVPNALRRSRRVKKAEECAEFASRPGVAEVLSKSP